MESSVENVKKELHSFFDFVLANLMKYIKSYNLINRRQSKNG